MKRTGLLVVLALGVAILAVAIVVKTRTHPQPKSAAVVAAAPAKVAPKQPPLMEYGDFQRYRAAREAALQSHPELKTEYNDVLHQMDTQADRFNAALAKADPEAAPALAKLAALRQWNSAAAKPGASELKSSPPPTMTPEDWQQVRAARTAAFAADPTLPAQAHKTADEMNDFENKLDAAILKASPDLAPIIAKFEAGRHQIQVAHAPVK